MLVRKITPSTLNLVAERANVGMPYEPYEASGGGLRVRFVPDRDPIYRGLNGHYRYQRRSASWSDTERKIFALCWHGYRDAFRILFELAPDAKVYTALARQAGISCYTSENFEQVFPKTGLINIGSAYMPVQAREACFCSETSDDCDPQPKSVNKPVVKIVRQNDLSSECWLVQIHGPSACETCEVKDTPECGGPDIRKTGKNEKGLSVPL